MTDDKRGKLIETLLELAEEFAVPSIPPDTYRTCRTADLIRAVDSMRAAAAALQPSIEQVSTANPERRSSQGHSEIKPDENERRSGKVDREGGGSDTAARSDALVAGRAECGTRPSGREGDRERIVTGEGASSPSTGAIKPWAHPVRADLAFGYIVDANNEYVCPLRASRSDEYNNEIAKALNAYGSARSATAPMKVSEEALKLAEYWKNWQMGDGVGTMARELLRLNGTTADPAARTEVEHAGGWIPVEWRRNTDPYVSDDTHIRQMRSPFYEGVKFCVRRHGNVLNKTGEWELEPMPSSRDDAFYERCRFDSFEAAVAVLDGPSNTPEGNRG